MAKKYKTILSLLLVVLIGVSIVMVTGVADINKIVKNKEKNRENERNTSYEHVFRSDTLSALRLMQTDIENIFYTMTTDGEVDFYKLDKGKIEKLKEKGALNLKITCSGQQLPAEVHYIEINKKTVGYGLFTNEKHPEICLYDYAFFKVTNMFPEFSSKSRLILMVDVDKNRFYSDQKVYSEIFYLYSSGSTEYFLSENQRIVDLNARLRTDYKMFTDDISEQTQNNILFFSSRYYTAYNSENKVDILTSGGGGENIDNLRYITDVASLNFWRTDKGTYYFSNTENGFVLKLFDGDKTNETVKSFEGDIKKDYIINGPCILHIKSGEVYNVLRDKTYKMDYNLFKMNFTPDLFDVSENGKYGIVRGANNFNKPALGVMDFENDKFYAYKDDIFGFVASMHALNDGGMAISVASGESASSYYQLLGVVGETLEHETTASLALDGELN